MAGERNEPLPWERAGRQPGGGGGYSAGRQNPQSSGGYGDDYDDGYADPPARAPRRAQRGPGPASHASEGYGDDTPGPPARPRRLPLRPGQRHRRRTRRRRPRRTRRADRTRRRDTGGRARTAGPQERHHDLRGLAGDHGDRRGRLHLPALQRQHQHVRHLGPVQEPPGAGRRPTRPARSRRTSCWSARTAATTATAPSAAARPARAPARTPRSCCTSTPTTSTPWASRSRAT